MRGYRVLDLTRLTPGAYMTMQLADLGADVIKIEEPRRGDYMREMVPEGFAVLNRNKRSLGLDLKREEGQEAFRRLVARADVLVESFRPGVMARLGLDYESLRSVAPHIVYCSLSGYGQSGPYREASGHDLNYLGTSGMINVLGSPRRPPEPVGMAVGDLFSAVFGAFSITAALLQKERTGVGQHLDVSMTDVLVSLMSRYVAEHATLTADQRLTMLQRAGYGFFETSDGSYISLGCIEDVFWFRFLDQLDADDQLQALRSGEDRDADPDMTNRLVADVVRRRSRQDWLALGAEHDVPIAAVNAMDEVAADPQVIARDLFHPGDGPSDPQQVRFPAILSESGAQVFATAPTLGRDTAAVLDDFGFAVAETDVLRADGVVS